MAEQVRPGYPKKNGLTKTADYLPISAALSLLRYVMDIEIYCDWHSLMNTATKASFRCQMPQVSPLRCSRKIRMLLDRCGSDKLLLGGDDPFCMPGHQLEGLLQMGIADSDLEMDCNAAIRRVQKIRDVRYPLRETIILSQRLPSLFPVPGLCGSGPKTLRESAPRAPSELIPAEPPASNRW